MEFDEVVKQRRSARGFTKKRANWKDVMYAIDSAIQGPFAGNHNNLKFLIVEEPGMIRTIAAFCEQHWIDSASTIVLVCSDETNLENIYGERGRVYSRQQAGAAIQTFLLKLADLGLGSCWVGAYNDEMLRAKLNIPLNILIEAVVPVGYAIGGEKKEKKALENVLYWEKWGDGKRPSIFQESKEDP